MAFKKYEAIGRGGERSLTPKVSIWAKSGLVNFNRAAAEKCNLGDYAYLLLYFDKDINRIGFAFTNTEGEKGRRRINKKYNRNTCSVRGFLNHCGVNFDENKKYDLTFDKENNLYIIQL